MTRARTSQRRRGGWVGTVAALLLLVVVGFVFGALVGFLWEEPRLVVAYLSGQTENLDWHAPQSPQDVAGSATPPVAAAPPARETEAAPAPPPPSVPQAEASSPPPSAHGSEARFAVQVGAFGESRAAEHLADRLREHGFDTYVTPGPDDGASRWRVRVGPVPEREAAERLAQRLKRDEELPTWVLEEGEG